MRRREEKSVAVGTQGWTPEFRAQIVKDVEEQRSIAQICAMREVTPEQIHKCIKRERMIAANKFGNLERAQYLEQIGQLAMQGHIEAIEELRKQKAKLPKELAAESRRTLVELRVIGKEEKPTTEIHIHQQRVLEQMTDEELDQARKLLAAAKSRVITIDATAVSG